MKKKAEAFSNKEWQQYWQLEGPSLLISGWKNIHPDIPFTKIQELSSLEFLSTTLEYLSLKPERDLPSHHNDLSPLESSSLTGSETVAPPTYDSVSSVFTNSIGVDSGEKMETQMKEVAEGSEESSCSLSDEEILRMWNEHYNSYYWYCFHLHQQQQQLQECVAESEHGHSEGQDVAFEVCF